MNCYRFESKEQFRALAEAEGLLTEDGDLITASHTHSLDEVGVISKGGEWDPETGEVITPPTVLDGWHVNLIAADAPEAWDQYLVVVNTAHRTFFGDSEQAPDTPTLEAMTQ
jgi:hypothetical protein